ncbi:unnamed protein product [Gemmata massiliana]|uniref:Uncharacterized protein n=1 Tax=Gemmata massiliana TaxID=1210884 RepID=A0A6P2D2A1_9BACT|nr:hypothetical protein [Gemmata massiliana]VTR95233.1 unnamed protein product [Gemmata massiliana]
MHSDEADRFFLSPHEPKPEDRPVSVLYLLRRDIYQCMGRDPDSGNEYVFTEEGTGKNLNTRALWPGAMTIMAGIDLLAKFFTGDDKPGKAGERFNCFLKEYFPKLDEEHRIPLYKLRNSLMHAFGLYSEDKDEQYKFSLSFRESQRLVTSLRADEYNVDLEQLRLQFEEAVNSYKAALESEPDVEKRQQLQAHFDVKVNKYGFINLKMI